MNNFLKGIFWFSLFSILILIIFGIIAFLEEYSYKWFIIPLGIIVFIYFVIFIVFITWFFTRRKVPQIEQPIDDLKELVIDRIKKDKDNPDNFIVLEHLPYSSGRGDTPTPLVIFYGYGSELLQERVVIINSVKPDKWANLIEPSKEEILETARVMADLPVEFEPEKTIQYDAFGRVVGVHESQRVKTYAQKTEESEKQEVENKIEGETS